MSTATQSPSSQSLTNLNTSPDAPIATDLYNVTVVEYTEKKEGKPVYDFLTDEDKAHKIVEAGEGKIIFQQAFVLSKAKTVEGINQLIPDNEENIVYFFNVGATQRQKNKAVAMLQEVGEEGRLAWEPTEEPYSMASVLTEDIKRRNLSDFEKAEKTIAGLPEAVKRAIMESLRQKLEG